MGWWSRYRAWRPEDSWDRYEAWRLETRARFVATGAGLRVLIVFFLSLLLGASTGRASLVAAIFAVPAILVWWFWYPRARVKGQHASVPARSRVG